MRKDDWEERGIPLKVLLAAAAAAAVAIGLALPLPNKSEAEPKSQFVTFEVGRG